MKLAIMQPYFFPYIGYFQLINTADKFVFYDDVNYIKNGWINRNKILINGLSKYITINLQGASSSKLIYEVGFNDNRKKVKKTILQAYRKAPLFLEVWPVIEAVFDYKTESISELAAFSVIRTCEYLKINTSFEFSSMKYTDTIHLRKEERLIEICKSNNALEYINPIGGTELYEKADFAKRGIHLNFLKTNPIQYPQFGDDFIPNLSIIDVMMFNSINSIRKMLNLYDII